MKTLILIAPDPIDILQAERFVCDESCGAIASFVGVTRRDSIDGGKVVSALEFEAHVELAKSVLSDIVSSYRLRDPDLWHVYIHHRLGIVPVGHGNVVIAVSSAHRKSAFNAVQELMDLLKAQLPVWKKEWFTDNSYRWSQNIEFNPH
jgi:molybdopterin synthase catalytic subunit